MAEASLKSILDKKYGEGNYEINEGDGAFYGTDRSDEELYRS